MIEERIIKVPEYESKQVTYICDTCGKRVVNTGWGETMKRCCICGGEICVDCAVVTSFDSLANGSFAGDYPDYYCPRCWNEGADIRGQILKSREVQENKEDKLWEQWHKLCAPADKGGAVRENR